VISAPLQGEENELEFVCNAKLVDRFHNTVLGEVGRGEERVIVECDQTAVSEALLWMAASMLFSWYVATFDSYNKTYGSLGAGVGFMVWLWISVVIVLLGGELNAEMEHQTARDTTEGGSKPLGSRGAMMADHVGEAQV
jgi:Virulence factor BrkB